MEKLKKLFYLLFLSTLAFSCGDTETTEPEPEEDTTPPGKVAGVIARSGYGTVTLKWTRPTDEDYGYTSVEFTRKGEPVALQARDSIVISGFEDTQSYEFSLFATDKKQNRAEAVKITATPGESPSALVRASVDFVLNSIVATVSWENITGALVTVTANYKDADGNPKSVSKMSTADRDFLSFKLFSEQTVDIAVSSGSVQQPPIEFAAAPDLTPDKKTWTVVSVSSEELTGEGSNNGRAVHAIDGTTSTFWHTKWTGGNVPTLPNFIVYNMQATLEFTKIKVTQRLNGKSLNTVEILLGPDANNLTQVGSLTFPDANGGSQEITFPEPVSGRILKLNMPDTRSSGKHSFIAEIEFDGVIAGE